MLRQSDSLTAVIAAGITLQAGAKNLSALMRSFGLCPHDDKRSIIKYYPILLKFSIKRVKLNIIYNIKLF